VRRIAVLLIPLAIGLGAAGSAGGSAWIRAQFTIRRGGAVGPRQITVPAHIPVVLSVLSHDGRPHRVLLRAPGAKPFTVPAHGQASSRFNHLAAGTYALVIDGAKKATLDIGGAPGP
jgi:hypothetical protein